MFSFSVLRGISFYTSPRNGNLPYLYGRWLAKMQELGHIDPFILAANDDRYSYGEWIRLDYNGQGMPMQQRHFVGNHFPLSSILTDSRDHQYIWYCFDDAVALEIEFGVMPDGFEDDWKRYRSALHEMYQFGLAVYNKIGT